MKFFKYFFAIAIPVGLTLLEVLVLDRNWLFTIIYIFMANATVYFLIERNKDFLHKPMCLNKRWCKIELTICSISFVFLTVWFFIFFTPWWLILIVCLLSIIESLVFPIGAKILMFIPILLDRDI